MNDNNTNSFDFDWKRAAIGGGTGLLGGLLFNRFILGNRTWKSHAIASAIGAALGGGGVTLYDYLDYKDRSKKKLTPEREKEVKKFIAEEENPTAGDKVKKVYATNPVVNVTTGAMGGAGAGHLVDKMANKKYRPETVAIQLDNGKRKTIPIQYGGKAQRAIGMGGIIDNKELAALSVSERQRLIQEISKNNLDIRFTPYQKNSPLLMGGVRPTTRQEEKQVLEILREARARRSAMPDIKAAKNEFKTAARAYGDARQKLAQAKAAVVAATKQISPQAVIKANDDYKKAAAEYQKASADYQSKYTGWQKARTDAPITQQANQKIMAEAQARANKIIGNKVRLQRPSGVLGKAKELLKGKRVFSAGGTVLGGALGLLNYLSASKERQGLIRDAEILAGSGR